MATPVIPMQPKRMEGEKTPPVYSEVTKDTVPILAVHEPQSRSPLQNGLILSLLVVFVTALACFAVYTIASMESAEKNTTILEKDALVGRTMEFKNNEGDKGEIAGPLNSNVRPKFKLSVYINGKPALDANSNEAEPLVPPSFPQVMNLFKGLISRAEKPFSSGSNEAKEISSEVITSSSEGGLKPKVFSTETVTVRRIPFTSNENFMPSFPFPSMFAGPIRPINEQTPIRKTFIIARRPITISSSSASSEEKVPFERPQFDPFKNFASIFRKILESKIKNSKEAREMSREEREPMIHIFPLGPRIITPFVRANRVVDFKKLDKAPLDKSKSDEDEFIRKFLGKATTPKSKVEEKKESTEKKSESEEDSFKKMPIFQNFMSDNWPRLEVGGRKNLESTQQKKELQNQASPSTTPAPTTQNLIKSTFSMPSVPVV